MTKGVFICKLQGLYDDCPEERYHFPRQYLDRVRAVVGDWIVYYESRRDGGRMVYFATAQVWDIEPDPRRPDHYYALVRHYLDFDEPVPFRENGQVYERSLLNPDGSLNPGLAQSAVHHVTDDEYYAILQRGFSRDVVVDRQAGAPGPHPGVTGFAEPPEDFERPLVEQLVRRPFRDRAFSEAVRRTYDYTCAVTGWCLRNGGGRPEVQAAHIQPVAAQSFTSSTSCTKNTAKIAHSLCRATPARQYVGSVPGKAVMGSHRRDKASTQEKPAALI